MRSNRVSSHGRSTSKSEFLLVHAAHRIIPTGDLVQRWMLKINMHGIGALRGSRTGHNYVHYGWSVSPSEEEEG